ncbi:hypothetical protein FND50_35070 [Rhodococcus sp. WB9]|nr:hypothetical protein FND50_35070 [Rhodococcus sp. WB9]
MKSSDYRRWRQPRHAAGVEVNRKRKHRDNEAAILIEFASMWAPYGGACEDDILVQFGLSRRQFIDRLWQTIPESNCALEEIQRLARAYPRRPRTNGFHSL